jgi:phage-related protein
MELKLPKLLYPHYESLQKMLTECGRIKREAQFDTKSLKMIVQSIVRMQKSLDSKDASEGIKEAIDEIGSNLSAELSSQISPILQSMSSEFESFKEWLDKRLTSFVDKEKQE